MSGAGLAHLVGRAALVEDRVRALVELRRSDDPAPDDAFRGLYVNDETVDRLLAGPLAPVGWSDDPDAEGGGRPAVEASAAAAEVDGDEVRLRRLARDAGLTDLDVELLVVALLPDLDARFERLYGYLNDDVTRRRASVGLALELAGGSTLMAATRARLEPSGPLLRHGLVLLEDGERPFLTRGLRVPDRVVAHLLGDDAPPVALAAALVEAVPYDHPLAARLARALRVGRALVHLRERVPGTGSGLAVAALAGVGRAPVVVDLGRADLDANALPLALREALLRGGGLVAGPVESLAERTPEALVALADAVVPVLLVGTASWDPRWSVRPPLTLEVPVPDRADRLARWRFELGTDALGAEAELLTGHLALGPGQVRAAVAAARSAAELDGGPIGPEELRRGVRGQNAAGLERLARRIEPEVGWDDLVLTPGVRRSLQDVAARARHRDTVLTRWRMRRGGGRGIGVTALFAGDSGTGKTMSAEVIATDLRLDLYTVNLATVVDKYVGETEKNLERIFTEAAGVNAVLFFDEADAIFGKRSEVRDAHDRYANIESAYLLQRLETFDGLAVLATNLRSNIDDAFTRRLDAIVDFPAPAADLRRSLWERCLTPPLPVDPDVDLDFLAAAFELAGGNIRSASTTAAYLAAADGTPVTMTHVVTAVEQEYRKLGRLVLEREFGRYHALVS